jgi:hypothetical protein
MLKKFAKFIKIKNSSTIDEINDIENKYIIFSNYSHENLLKINIKISQFKIHSLLLLNDSNFYVKLRNLSCEHSDEYDNWNSKHIQIISQILSHSKIIYKLIYFAYNIKIISHAQYNLMDHIHNLILNIFVINKIYYKEKFDNNDNIILNNIPTQNEFKFYFNILEIITKVFFKYFDKQKNKIFHNNMANDDHYLQLILNINKSLS